MLVGAQQVFPSQITLGEGSRAPPSASHSASCASRPKPSSRLAQSNLRALPSKGFISSDLRAAPEKRGRMTSAAGGRYTPAVRQRPVVSSVESHTSYISSSEFGSLMVELKLAPEPEPEPPALPPPSPKEAEAPPLEEENTPPQENACAAAGGNWLQWESHKPSLAGSSVSSVTAAQFERIFPAEGPNGPVEGLFGTKPIRRPCEEHVDGTSLRIMQDLAGQVRPSICTISPSACSTCAAGRASQEPRLRMAG